MKIREVSVSTFKNHIETEIFLDGPASGCYIIQRVQSADADSFIVFNTMTGAGSARILTCGDAVPAVPSTKENPFHYNLITELFDEKDEILDSHSVLFEFKIPDEPKACKKNFFSRLNFFGKQQFQ